ncbi:MAG: hypothetical protein U0Q15_01500 [Kineosporiaceae bacterium]
MDEEGPVTARMREYLVAALVEVGCPEHLAGAIVDEYASFGADVGAQAFLWLYDQGAWQGDSEEISDDALRQVCRDLAESLDETNDEFLVARADGHDVPVFWSAPATPPSADVRRDRGV